MCNTYWFCDHLIIFILIFRFVFLYYFYFSFYFYFYFSIWFYSLFRSRFWFFKHLRLILRVFAFFFWFSFEKQQFDNLELFFLSSLYHFRVEHFTSYLLRLRAATYLSSECITCVHRTLIESPPWKKGLK